MKHVPTLAHLAAATALVGLLAGCGSGHDHHDDHDAGAPTIDTAPADVCPGGTKGDDGLVTCPGLFDGDEPVRLPADPSDSERFGAVVRGGTGLWTRDGVLPLSDAAREKIVGENVGGQDVIADGMPYASQVYGALVRDGEVVDVRPVVRVDEDAIVDRLFAGTVLEGGITRFADGAWDGMTMLPVRIEVGERAGDGSLSATIVNSSSGVASSTGTCLPALTADPATNPLRDGYTADVGLERYPSMHADFDDEMLLTWANGSSDMGAELYPSMATVLGGDPLDDTWMPMIHGTPTAGPSFELHVVEGGGGACS